MSGPTTNKLVAACITDFEANMMPTSKFSAAKLLCLSCCAGEFRVDGGESIGDGMKSLGLHICFVLSSQLTILKAIFEHGLTLDVSIFTDIFSSHDGFSLT